MYTHTSFTITLIYHTQWQWLDYIMSSYRFAMCYKNSSMLCSPAIYCTVTLPYPKFTFDHVHLLSMVLPFFLVGCTFHFVLLERHLKAVFHSILFSVHIFFICILFIRILLITFHSYTFHSYTFHSNTFHFYTFH